MSVIKTVPALVFGWVLATSASAQSTEADTSTAQHPATGAEVETETQVEAETQVDAAPAETPWKTQPHAKANHAKTWYVMLAIYEPRTAKNCARWTYKVSTNDPMVIDGPEKITPAHADAVVTAWLIYLRDRSPTAYKWINGTTGNHVNEIYFRTNEAEAREDFAKGGHMERDWSCGGAVLLKHGVSKFRFSAPENFTQADFGVPSPPKTAKAPEIADAAGGL